MVAPITDTRFAYSEGAPILAGLTVTDIAFYDNYRPATPTDGAVMEATFSGGPNLSGVVAGHSLTISGTTNAQNAGTFEIKSVDNTAKTIRFYNYAITDNSYDESGTFSANIDESISVVQEPTTAKRVLGWFNGERIAAGYLNWLFREIGAWIYHFATGGAIAIRDTLAAWQAEDRSDAGQGMEFVKGYGFLRHDPDADEEEPGEGVTEPTGGGTGRAFNDVPHTDGIWNLLALDVQESLPAVQATLDFPSISASDSEVLTVTVSGAKEGDFVQLAPPASLNADLQFWGWVTADDEVTVKLYNPTGSPINPASASWGVFVTGARRMAPITLKGLKLYSNLLGGAYANGAALETDLGLADNEAHFRILVNNVQRRRELIDDAAIKTIIQGSTIADQALIDTGDSSY